MNELINENLNIMKKLIRWIAEVTGVAKQIRVEAYKEVGDSMQHYAYWFTGGLAVQGTKFDMSNVLYEYPNWCLKKGYPNLFGSQQMDLRQYLWELSDEGKSIIVEKSSK